VSACTRSMPGCFCDMFLETNFCDMCCQISRVLVVVEEWIRTFG